jgi:hypothetical protein
MEVFASWARGEENARMSYYEATDQTESDDDLWHVQLASGDVLLMTLEELDDSFQNGVINENTFLWQEGATNWVTLREVAGLDADDTTEDAGALPGNPFTSSSSDSVWPPAPAAPSFGYSAQVNYAPPIQVMGPNSTAPVVSPMRDMEFDLDSIEFRPKKRSGGRWLFAAAFIGAAGFGAVKYKVVPMPQLGAMQAFTAAAASPVPASEPVAAPVRTPDPPAPVVAAPAPTAESAKDTALADDVKQRLAKADKALADKQKLKQQQVQQRQQKSAASHPRRGPSSGEKVFHKGGETGDPLNSAL